MIKKLYRSARWDHTLNISLVTEVLFICFVLFISYGWSYAINTASIPFFASADNLANVAPNQIDAVSATFSSFLFVFFAANILYVLALLFSFTLSRAIIWAKMFRKQLTLTLYFRFVGLKIFWFLIWLPLLIIVITPLVLLSSAVQVNAQLASTYSAFVYLGIIILCIMYYFGAFLNRAYFTHHMLYRAITDAFKHGVLHFPKLILPLLLCAVCLLLLLGLYWILIILGLSHWISNMLIGIFVYVILKRFMIAQIRDR